MSSEGPTLPTNEDYPLPRTNYDGGDLVGNGGGGLCFGSQCLTLAEAGFRVAGPIEPFYIPSVAIAKEVENLSERLPLSSYRKDFVKSVVGSGKTFIRLEIEDKVKIEALRVQYAKVLQENNSQIDPKQVKIFAFSRIEIIAGFIQPTEQTYLLPDFFLLNEFQQAKVLLHEHNVRGRFHKHFFEALEYDGLVEDLLGTTNFTNSKFRMDRWSELLDLFFKKNSLSSQPLANWLAWYKEVEGVIFDALKVCEFGYNTCRPLAISFGSNYSISPAFYRFLDQTYISFSYESLPLDLSDQGDSIVVRFINEMSTACSLVGYRNAVILLPFNFFGVDYHLSLVRCGTNFTSSKAYLFKTY